VALEEEEAALGLGPFFWLSWQAFLYLHWCRLLVLLSMGGLVDTPLVDLIAMGWKLIGSLLSRRSIGRVWQGKWT
jgi:hypothetical protein